MAIKKTLSVSAIKDGTVIDHVTAGRALDIVRLLRLTQEKKQITLGLYLESRARGRKDLIKIEALELSTESANRVALLAPGATINIIKNYAVVKKFQVVIPQMIERLIVCPNPSCITNHERMISVFFVKNQATGIQLACKYCERLFRESDIQIYNP